MERIVATAQILNSPQSFKGSFLGTGATIRWSVEQPGLPLSVNQGAVALPVEMTVSGISIRATTC
jgi:hypothetical protein